jgi:hypothetical protein
LSPPCFCAKIEGGYCFEAFSPHLDASNQDMVTFQIKRPFTTRVALHNHRKQDFLKKCNPRIFAQKLGVRNRFLHSCEFDANNLTGELRSWLHSEYSDTFKPSGVMTLVWRYSELVTPPCPNSRYGRTSMISINCVQRSAPFHGESKLPS